MDQVCIGKLAGILAVLSLLMAAPVEAQQSETVDAIDTVSKTGGASGGPNDQPGDEPGDEPGSPWVQGVPLDRRRAARKLFLEGNVLIKDTLFVAAAARYRDAIALWDHPAFHYNLAIALINLDQPIEAHESLGRALRHGPAPLGPEKYQQARNYRTLLGNQLARLEVICDEPGAEVTLNGKRLLIGPGRYQGMVRPGEYQLVAGKAGRIPATRQIELSPGETGQVALVLSAPAAVETARRWDTWKPWAVVSAGTAVLLAGGYLDWRSTTNFDRFDRDFDALCVRGCPYGELPQALSDRLARAQAQQRAAQLSYVAAGAVLATGAVLVYLNREQLMLREGADENQSVSRLRVAPVLWPGVAGMSAGLRF